MRIYIAAPYPERKRAVEVGRQLEQMGHQVTSRWLTIFDQEGHYGAMMDLEDIIACDVLLALNAEEWRNKGSGGRHIEFGYALALGRSLVILGARTSIFHHLHGVRCIERVEDL